MPELPEVETIRLTLIDKQLVGKTITRILLPPSRLLKDQLSERKLFLRSFIKETIIALERRGKYLLFQGQHHSLILHLGMSGVIHWRSPGENVVFPDKHRYLHLFFHDGGELLFTDPRTFGRIIPLIHYREKIAASKSKDLNGLFNSCIKNLGPDALIARTTVLTRESHRRASRSHRPVKSLILDQSVIAGIGNIYADESLFRARISPLRPAHSLLEKDWKRLIAEIRRVLHKALKAGGSSISDYRRPDGLQGRFQNDFSVYGKENHPCPHCQEPLQKTFIQSRCTVFCRNCQK